MPKFSAQKYQQQHQAFSSKTASFTLTEDVGNTLDNYKNMRKLANLTAVYSN